MNNFNDFIEKYNIIAFDIKNIEESEILEDFFYDYNFFDYDEGYYLENLDLNTNYITVCIDSDQDTPFGSCNKEWLDSGEYKESDFIKNELYRFYPDVLKINDLRKLKILFDSGRNYFRGQEQLYRPRTMVYENSKVIRFNDFDNIEYRKGSKEFGGLLTKLLEYLRLIRKDEKELTLNLKEFEEKSNITKEELNSLVKAKEEGKNLFDFDIIIEGDTVTFTGFDSGKARPFESVTAIRTEYEDLGVEDFYKQKGSDYINPHLKYIEESIKTIVDGGTVDLSKVLDLASGTGEVTNILNDLGYYDIDATDPYLFKEYEENTGYKCMKYSFLDIQQGKLKIKKYSAIICSYGLHLADKSILHDLFWELSMISDYLIIISPNKRPEVSEDSWELVNEFKNVKSKIRIYTSKNSNI